MSIETSGSDLPNTFTETIRQMAAEQADSLERKSLLESAAKVDAADAMIRQSLNSAQDDVLRMRAEMDALRRRNDLPTWGVVSVLLAFALFLVYVALKHHV